MLKAACRLDAIWRFSHKSGFDYSPPPAAGTLFGALCESRRSLAFAPVSFSSARESLGGYGGADNRRSAEQNGGEMASPQ
jgi:hypothetical protein